MLDVLHYYFEEDYMSVSLEESQRTSAVRETVYQNMYGREYPYALGNGEAKTSQYDFGDPEDEDYEDDLADIDPFKPAAKPYTPATKVNPEAAKPFGNILDAPLG